MRSILPQLGAVTLIMQPWSCKGVRSNTALQSPHKSKAHTTPSWSTPANCNQHTHIAFYLFCPPASPTTWNLQSTCTVLKDFQIPTQTKACPRDAAQQQSLRHFHSHTIDEPHVSIPFSALASLLSMHGFHLAVWWSCCWQLDVCPGSFPSASPLLAQAPFLSNLWVGMVLGVLPHRPLWQSAGCSSTKGSSWVLSPLSGLSAPWEKLHSALLQQPLGDSFPWAQGDLFCHITHPNSAGISSRYSPTQAPCMGNSGIQKHTFVCLGPGFFKKCSHMWIHHRGVSPAATVGPPKRFCAEERVCRLRMSQAGSPSMDLLLGEKSKECICFVILLGPGVLSRCRRTRSVVLVKGLPSFSSTSWPSPTFP